MRGLGPGAWMKAVQMGAHKLKLMSGRSGLRKAEMVLLVSLSSA